VYQRHIRLSIYQITLTMNFCATPNRTLSLNTSLQYKQGTTYPQRTYSSSGITLTNATTNITLYLLESGDGIYQELFY